METQMTPEDLIKKIKDLSASERLILAAGLLQRNLISENHLSLAASLAKRVAEEIEFDLWVRKQAK